jgi:protein-disulfide isomerase
MAFSQASKTMSRASGGVFFSAVWAAACGGAAPVARSTAAPIESSHAIAAVPTAGATIGATPKAPEAAAQPDTDGDDDDSKARFKIPIGSSPARGGATALVTIVEFADYQCPYCAVAEETLRDLRGRYGEALRFVFKDAPLPFHPWAEPAAEAALEVRAEKGDAAFWAVHDQLFDHARELSTDAIVRLAQAAGAPADRVRAAMSKHSHAAEIEADEDLADDFDAEGTPYFFIDGRRLVGAQPRERFAALVDEELKAANALIAAGTRPEAIYDALLKDAQAPQAPDRIGLDALPAGDPARGPATAKVTVHEFADFQCPFCVRAEVTVRRLETRYGDRVRFVWHDLPLPFHDSAVPAARAAREARKQGGDRAFWQMHDRLLTDGARLARADLDVDARGLGLNMAKWTAALDGDAHDDEIAVDRRAAEALGLNGTPSFLVVPAGAATGYSIVGAQSYAKFHKLIEHALAEAR